MTILNETVTENNVRIIFRCNRHNGRRVNVLKKYVQRIKMTRYEQNPGFPPRWDREVKLFDADGARVLNAALDCTECGQRMIAVEVKGLLVEGHACNAACTNAVGSSCKCACAGAHHGDAWAV